MTLFCPVVMSLHFMLSCFSSILFTIILPPPPRLPTCAGDKAIIQVHFHENVCVHNYPTISLGQVTFRLAEATPWIVTNPDRVQKKNVRKAGLTKNMSGVWPLTALPREKEDVVPPAQVSLVMQPAAATVKYPYL